MSSYKRVSPTTNITYKVKLVHGNYRVYKNGAEIWKSEGKENKDFEAAKHWVNITLKNDDESAQKPKESEEEKPPEPSPFDNMASQTKDFRDLRGFEYDLTEFIKAESRKTGIPKSEILDGINSDPENNMPSYIKEKHPEYSQRIPDGIYNNVSYLITQKDDTGKLGDIFDEAREKRDGITSDLKEKTLGRRADQDDTELAMLLNPEISGNKYSDLFDLLTDEQKATANPETLRRIAQEQEGQKLKDLGNQQSEEAGVVKSKIELDPLKLWQTVSDTYQAPTDYDSDSIYNKRSHNLAASGHGPGSSSLNYNASQKDKSRYESDHKGKLELFDRFLNHGTMSRSDWINVNKEQGRSMSDPFKTSADSLNQSINRDNENQYKQDIFKKDIATGEINNEGQNLNESLSMYNTNASVNQAQQQQAMNTLDSIYQLGLQEQNFNQLNEEDKRKVELQRENIWAQRQQVLIDLGKLNLAKQEREDLERARKVKSKMEFISLITKVAAAAAITIGTGGAGAPAALALFAPEAGSALSKTPGYFGNAATSQSSPQSTTDPLMGKVPGIN
jgi:hypothetical protein